MKKAVGQVFYSGRGKLFYCMHCCLKLVVTILDQVGKRMPSRLSPLPPPPPIIEMSPLTNVFFYTSIVPAIINCQKLKDTYFFPFGNIIVIMLISEST